MISNPNVFDQQIAGVRDDGSAEGIVRTELVNGNLVRISASTFNTYAELGSGSSAVYQNGSIPYNQDASFSALNIVPTINGYVSLWVVFYGRTFGVRVRHSTQPFTVSVDGGDALRIGDLESYVVLEGRQAVENHEVSAITHSDLSNGMHIAKIMFSANATSSIFLGYLVDEKWYARQPSVHTSATAIAVTASPVIFTPILAGLSTVPLRYISKIIYFNTTASAITITWATGNLFSVPANGYTEFNFTTPIASGCITHSGSGLGVNAVAFGGYF